MYVCLCHRVNDAEIRRHVEEGVDSLRQLRKRSPIGRGCGRCLPSAREIIDEHRDACKALGDPHLDASRCGLATG